MSQVSCFYQGESFFVHCFQALVPLCFISQASLRESWLDDMMHVLEGEALGQDAATVEAAFKRHEAISTDVKARVGVKNIFWCLQCVGLQVCRQCRVCRA